MSIQAKLYIDEIEYTVLKFDFDFQKQADVNGRPTTKYTGGLFHFAVESINKTDILLWSVNPTEMKEIKLVISPRHGSGKSRTIILGDSICLQFMNEYFSENNQPLKDYFTVSPGYMIQNGQIIFEKNWKRTNLIADVEATRISNNENEPEVVDYYITDLEGTKKPEYEVGDKIYVVVKTRNMTGKELTLKLTDKTKDFKYKDEILPNDRLENYVINSNIEKIKLEVVQQKMKN